MAHFTLQELKDIQAEYQKAQADGIPISKELAQRYKDATIGIKNYSAQLEQSLKQFGSNLLSSVLSSERGASKYNSAITSGADAISDFAMRFGPLGVAAGLATKGLSLFVTAVTKQSDALFKTYQDLSQTGITGSSGLKGVFDNLQNFGFTVDKIGEYTGLIQKNSDIMNRFGSTANEGAARMGQITKTIRDSSAGKNLRLMGMSSEAIANSTLQYARLQTLVGAGQKVTDQELIEGGTKYAEQLMKASKLTGASADKLQGLDQQVFKHAQMGSALALKRQAALDSRSKEAMDAYKKEEADVLELNRILSERLGPEVAEAALSLRSGGPANENAVKVLRTYPELYDALRREGKTTADVIEIAEKEAKEKNKSLNIMNIALGENSTFVGVQARNQAQNLKGYRDAEKAANKESKVTDKATESAVSLDISQQDITQALDSLVNLGITPVTTLLSGLANKINFFLDPFGRKATGATKAAVKEQNERAASGSTAAMVGAGGAELTPEEQKKYGTDASGKALPGQATSSATPKTPTTQPATTAPTAGPSQTMPATGATPRPSAAMGGVISGPRSGYTATLHGTEAVVPLPNGQNIPVDMPDLSGVLNDQSNLLNGVLSALDDIVKNMEAQVGVSKKILMRQM